MKLPNNVVENNLSEMSPPDNYAGLVYRWTDLVNLEIYENSGEEVPIYYLGSHGSNKELTAYVGDGYWHSSKNKEFAKVFSDSSSRLRYEILEYFNLKYDMEQKEYTMLNDVDAKNNPLYYNLSNGIVMNKEPRLLKCQEFVKDIQARKWPVVKEKIEDLTYLIEEGYPRIQVRVTDNSDKQVEIANRIDDAGGNTDECEPLVIYADRGGEGGHVLGDGNTTLVSGEMAKHATDLPRMHVPKEVHGEFSDAELEVVGNLLNPQPQKLKTPTDVDAGIKYVVRRYDEGLPVDSSNNKSVLEAYGHTKANVNKILKKAKKEIDNRELSIAGLTLINYESGPGKKKLERKLEQARNENTVSISFPSGFINWLKIQGVLKDKREELDKIKSPHTVVCKMFIYHKTKQGYKVAKECKRVWDEQMLSYWTKEISYWIGAHPKKFEVIIETLDMTETT